MPDRIDVLIAEDDDIVRHALVDLVGSDPRLQVVGDVGDAQAAIDLADRLHPTVALLDVKMPQGGGVRAAREIGACSPGTAIVALTAYDDRETIVKMLRAGAIGYVVKGASPATIVDAIEASSRRAATLSPEVSVQVIEGFVALLDDAERISQEFAALNRTKAALLDTLAHEFLTPVTVITGSASTMAEYAERLSPSDVAMLAGMITNGVGRLRRLMDNVATACRLQSSTLNLRSTPTALRAVTERVQSEFAGSADALRFDIGLGDIEAWLDGALATRALSVVVENALQFSPEGERVRIDTIADLESAGFRVTDAGPGMSADERATAFDRFARLGNARNEAHQGMGLGLFLARRVMDLHGGTIEAESEPGHGASFTLLFPRYRTTLGDRD